MARLFFSLSLFLVSSSLFSLERFEDRQEVKRGIYFGAMTGEFYFLDSADRARYGDAWLVGMKAGYDVLKYLSVEGRFKFSAHSANPVGLQNLPPTFVAYQSQLVVRGGYPVFRRLTLFADVGGGLWISSPNILPTIGNAMRPMATFGLGFQYFTKMRGLTVGLEPNIGVIRDLNGPIAQLQGHLRYTF